MRAKLILSFSAIAFFAFSAARMLAGGNDFPQSAHCPSDGDKVTKTHYVYHEVSKDSLSTWDFSEALETGESHSMQWINVGDTILVKKELGAQLTYNVKENSLILISYESPLFVLRDSIPFSFNAECGVKQCPPVPFSSEGSYCNNNYVSYKGRLSTGISDRGTLILPNDTIDNVLKVTHHFEGAVLVSEDKFPGSNDDSVGNTLNHEVVIERWYSPAFKYALVENVYDKYFINDETVKESCATFMCAPEAQEYCLGTSCAPSRSTKKHSTKDSKSKGNDNRDFMNNSSGNVAVDFEDGVICVRIASHTDVDFENTSGVLCDQLGRVWKSFSGTDLADGAWQTRISTKELPQGNYILYVSIGGVPFSKKLIIQ